MSNSTSSSRPMGTTPPEVEGVLSRTSPFSADVTLEHLKASIHNHHLILFAQMDHSDEAKRVGPIMQEAHLLVVGSPQAGTPLMIASPLLALDLPLKALIWQDQAGHVWVSYERTTSLARRFAIPAELVKNIAGIDGVIESALQA